jgi:cytoskeleton protein RodZ
MPTIGQKLEETRLSRGLGVEDVAHATRIHRNLILSIEEDDFSCFPSVAYAKSFIRKYGDHLGLDLSEATDALNGGRTRFGENDLLIEMQRTIKKDRPFRLERFGKTPRLRSARKSRRPIFLNLILGTLITSIGIFYFLGYNAPNAREAKEGIARGLGLSAPAPAPNGGSPIETNPLKSSLPVGKQSATAPPPAGSATNPPTVDVHTPAAPATPPASPSPEEAVGLKPGEAPVDSVAKASSGSAAPRPSPAPTLDSGTRELTPPPVTGLTSPRVAGLEPEAVPRPEGTDPAATTRRQTGTPSAYAAPTPQTGAGGSVRPLRAEPVAVPE